MIRLLFFITPVPRHQLVIDFYIKSCWFPFPFFFSTDAQCSKPDSNASLVEKQQTSEMRSFSDNGKLQIR